MIIEWSSRALSKFPGSQLLFQAGRGFSTHLALAADVVPAGGRERLLIKRQQTLQTWNKM